VYGRSFEVQIVLCRKVSSLSCRPTIARKQQQRKKGKRIKKEKTRRGRKGRKMRCRKEELPRSRWQMGMVGEVVVGVGEMVVRVGEVVVRVGEVVVRVGEVRKRG